MKKRIAVIVFALAVFFTGTVLAAEFSDVPENHWAYSVIDELSDKNIINGIGNGLYNPDGTLTRAQFVKLLTCTLEDYSEQDTYKAIYTDTPDGQWYTPYVTCGVYSGIVEKNGNFFYPDEYITRGEAAVWIVNGTGIDMDAECSFSDVTYAQEKNAVAIASAKGIINGYEDGTFRPGNTLTRAEAAALISRIDKNAPVFGKVREDAANQAVTKDSLKYAEIGENNKITATSKAKKTITFSHPCEVVASLEKGDVLYIPESDGYSDILVKVSDVTASKGKVTVTCEAPKISDVFESLDISAVVSPSESDLAKNENISLPQASSLKGMQNPTGGVNIDGGTSISTDAEWKDGKLVWKVPAQGSASAAFNISTPSYSKKQGAYASLDMSLQVLVDICLSGENFDADVYARAEALSDIYAIAGYSNSKSAVKEIELPSIEMKVAGPISVEVTPYIVTGASGEFTVEASATLTHSAGGEFKDGSFSAWSDPKMSTTLYANAEGSLEIGPKLKTDIAIGGVEFLDIDSLKILNFTADIGLGITGKTEIKQGVSLDKQGGSYSGNQNTPDENGVLHNCVLCVEGDIYAYDQFSVGLSDDLNEFLDDIIGKKATYTTKRGKMNYSPWHYSMGEWGGPECKLESCPHKLIRVSGKITEKETGKILPGAVVTWGNKAGYADSSGRYEIFVEAGPQTIYTAEAEHQKSAATVKIPEDKEITLNFVLEPKEVKVKGTLTDSETGEVIPEAIVKIGDKSAVTNINGYYELMVEADKYTVSATAMGFYDYSQSFDIETNDTIINISMLPVPWTEYVLDIKYQMQRKSPYNEWGEVTASLYGKTVWTYTSEKVPSAQINSVSEIYTNNGVAYFTAGGKLNAMDIRKGKLLWQLAAEEEYARIICTEGMVFDGEGNIHMLTNFANYKKVSKDGQLLANIGFGADMTKYEVNGSVISIYYYDNTAAGASEYRANIDMITGTVINKELLRTQS